jgi:competence protein ComEA
MKRRSSIILTIIIGVILSVTVILSLAGASKNRDIITGVSAGGIIHDEKEPDKIKIYVTGEVINPGIVEVEKGSTILDAVEACGGFGDNASGNINLVYALNENITLIIKSADDGGGASVVKSPGDAILIDSENGLIDGKININHADASALGLLPGIGEKTAMDIIDYRNANGLFSAIEDIMGVPGIKESKFEKIKDYISIE